MFPASLRLATLVIAAALVTCATASPASATSSGPIAVVDDCLDAVVLLPGVEKRVRERVPSRFELVRDPIGRPLLFAFASRCHYTVNGRTTQASTISGYFVALIQSPDGTGCMSRWPIVGTLKPDLLPVCNFYFLSGAWNDPTIVSTYRAFSPDIAISYVPDLVFEQGRFDLLRLGAPLRFRAGAPTPSPFELDAVVREQPVASQATFSFYTGSLGTVGARLEIDGLALGQMDAKLRVAPGSEIATLLGTATPTPIAGLVGRYEHGEVSLLGPDS